MCVQRLRTLDPAFAEAATTGLLWELLSWRIDEEEPDGCTIIQAAMNAKNGLFLIRHEMQAIACATFVEHDARVRQRR